MSIVVVAGSAMLFDEVSLFHFIYRRIELAEPKAKLDRFAIDLRRITARIENIFCPGVVDDFP